MFLQNNRGLIYHDPSFSISKACYSSRGAGLLVANSGRNGVCQKAENSMSFIESLMELSHNTILYIMSITYNLTLMKCKLKSITKITPKESTKFSKAESAKKAEVVFSLIRYVYKSISGLQPQREEQTSWEQCFIGNDLTTGLFKMYKQPDCFQFFVCSVSW